MAESHGQRSLVVSIGLQRVRHDGSDLAPRKAEHKAIHSFMKDLHPGLIGSIIHALSIIPGWVLYKRHHSVSLWHHREVFFTGTYSFLYPLYFWLILVSIHFKAPVFYYYFNLNRKLKPGFKFGMALYTKWPVFSLFTCWEISGSENQSARGFTKLGLSR